MKKVRAENGFSKLLEEAMSNEVAYAIEEYICSMYHFKCDENIIKIMTKMFEEKSKPQSAQQPDHYIKWIDLNNFSLWRSAPKKYTKKVWFITLLYKTVFVTYALSEYISIYYGREFSKCGNFLELSSHKGAQIQPEIKPLEGIDINNEGGEILEKMWWKQWQQNIWK